jgi:hypothetical protein
MTRSRDVADTQDNLGGAVPPFVAGKNVIINGGFDIFQRTSVSNSTDSYGLDRWHKTSSGSGSNVSVTQQTTGVPAGSRFCMRVTMTGLNGYGNQYQIIETLNVVPLQGKTITINAKVRRNSAYAGNLTVSLEKASAVDAGMGGSYSTVASQGVLNASIPTGTTSADWYTISLTTTIPNDGTANTLRLGVTQSQTESNCYWELAQVQLELGSVATPFSRAAGTIQGELAACQRYYFRYTPDAGTLRILSTGQCVSTTVAGIAYKYPVTMRTRPTALEQSGTAGNYGLLNATGTTLACTAVPAYDSATTTEFGWFLFTVASGLVAGNATVALSASTSGHLGWSAEL